MKRSLKNLKTIRCAQVKILSGLMKAPLHKLSVYFNTEFDKVFRLEEEEKSSFDLAWTMLCEDGMVYTASHEMGIKEEAVGTANCFMVSLKEQIKC